MRRQQVKMRDNWREKFEDIGFSFHSLDGSYWNEGICYEFTREEIDIVDMATGKLHDLCIEAAGYIIDNGLYEKVGIPARYASLIENSWQSDERSIYGRFDLSYDGKDDPKLLEYNADTPTSLVEASIAQWVWLEELFPSHDQFNSIHQKLIEAFKKTRLELPPDEVLYFTCVKDHEEDFTTVEYLRDTAIQAGIATRQIFIEDIGYLRQNGCFCDLENRTIRYMFKLYPWEWLLADDFGPNVFSGTIRLIEPPWKMLLSNKGILPILWDMYPGHPNLLPSYFDPTQLRGHQYVRKPLFSREGANVSRYDGATTLEETEGTYGAEGFVYQQTRLLPCFEGNYPVIGSWVISGYPAGIGIREDHSPVTTNTSRFVPHYFKP
jgi:glutathionylspermidine synthase